MGPARTTWNQFIETRVAKTASALANIKGIKMLGLEPTITDFVQRLRVEEVESSKPFRILTAVTSATGEFNVDDHPSVLLIRYSHVCLRNNAGHCHLWCIILDNIRWEVKRCRYLHDPGVHSPHPGSACNTAQSVSKFRSHNGVLPANTDLLTAR